MTDKKTMESASHSDPSATDAPAPSSDPHTVPSPPEASHENRTATPEGPSEKGALTPAELEEKLKAVERQAAENHDRFLRIAAELDNFRKRKEREVTDLRKYANQALLRELLGVVDNLERALASSWESGEPKSLAEGVEMTLKELLKIFDQYGVQPIVSLQQPFDPNVHEAVMQEPSDEVPPNTVIKELQKGYLLRDRLLRPAMVVVSTEST